nr:MAG: hypothetical protein [Trichoderma gamsii alphapartitivirus 1]
MSDYYDIYSAPPTRSQPPTANPRAHRVPIIGSGLEVATAPTTGAVPSIRVRPPTFPATASSSTSAVQPHSKQKSPELYQLLDKVTSTKHYNVFVYTLVRLTKSDPGHECPDADYLCNVCLDNSRIDIVNRVPVQGLKSITRTGRLHLEDPSAADYLYDQLCDTSPPPSFPVQKNEIDINQLDSTPIHELNQGRSFPVDFQPTEFNKEDIGQMAQHQSAPPSPVVSELSDENPSIPVPPELEGSRANSLTEFAADFSAKPTFIEPEIPDRSRSPSVIDDAVSPVQNKEAIKVSAGPVFEVAILALARLTDGLKATGRTASTLLHPYVSYMIDNKELPKINDFRHEGKFKPKSDDSVYIKLKTLFSLADYQTIKHCFNDSTSRHSCIDDKFCIFRYFAQEMEFKRDSTTIMSLVLGFYKQVGTRTEAYSESLEVSQLKYRLGKSIRTQSTHDYVSNH